MIALHCASSTGLQPTISLSDFSRILLRLFFFVPNPVSLPTSFSFAWPPSRVSLSQPVKQYYYLWWQPEARSTAERVRLFAESTRVYGDNFVIIEQCTVDTKTMWWNIHNHPKWAFICKYNCTIKAQCCSWGKTAWTGHTLSWQAEPPFFNKKPLQLKTLSAWVLVAATQRYFSRQPPKSWKLWPPWPPLALVQSWLYSVPASKQL